MRKGAITDHIDWIFISSRTVRRWLVLLVLCSAAVVAYLHYGSEMNRQAAVRQSGFGSSIEKKVAQIVEIVGDVKVKRVNQLKWIPARDVNHLEEGDLLQTEAGSTARLNFFDGSAYMVNAESLISIQKSYEDRTSNKREVMLEVTSGGVGVATAKRNGNNSSFGVQTPNASAVFEEFSIGEAKYDRRMNESQFFVYKGGADVISRKAEAGTVHLASAEEVKVDATNRPREKSGLPPSPALNAPKNLGLFVTSDPRQLKVRFMWAPVEGIRSYRLRVSSSSTFQPLLAQKNLSGLTFDMVTPDFGPYFWRVDAVNSQGLESPPGDVYSFTVIPKRREDTPSHDIHIKIDKILPFGHAFHVVGKTDPGVMIYINEEVVEVKGDGSFKHFTRPFIAKGKQKLVIVGRDLTGLSKSLQEIVEVK